MRVRTRSRISLLNETSTSWQIGSWNAEERYLRGEEDARMEDSGEEGTDRE
jgi:hypothetical protein